MVLFGNFSLISSASSLETPSLTVFGAPSTKSLASFNPNPVTSLTTLITLGALYIFGGETTKEFVFAMIVGIAIGTYSSIFFASTLLDWWREKQEAKGKSSNCAKPKEGAIA